MKAALLVEHGKPLELAEIEPEPLSYGQVLVRIISSGICGAQLQEIDGHKMGGPLPHPLGHEACARVIEVGPAVRQVRVGDKVCCHWRKGDGIESDFPKYRYGDKIITSGKVTTFSEYAVCSENRLTPVPNDTPDDLVALLGCGLSTALGTIEQEANLKMGESVLIIGCGGLGLNLILAAKMRMASCIHACDIREDKQTVAKAIGATTFGPIPGPYFDVVIDTSGNETVIAAAINALAPSGRLIMVGHFQKHASVRFNHPDNMFEGEGKTIKATQGGMFRPSQDIPRYVRLHQAGMLNLDGIISHRIPLSEINHGIELVRNGQAGRVLIQP